MPVSTVTIKPTVAELMPLELTLLILRRNIFLGRGVCLVGKEQNQQRSLKQVLRPWTII